MTGAVSCVQVLLRKLSNEIISRCCAHITLPDVFSGEVDNVMLSLRQVGALDSVWLVCVTGFALGLGCAV